MVSELLTNIEKQLQSLQYTADESRVYLACLTLGTSPASAIARNVKLPRSTTYLILDSLCKKGLVSQVKEETKKMYSPTAPDKIADLFNTHINQLQNSKKKFMDNLSQLNSLYNSHNPIFPKVRFYTGDDGLKTVLYDSLSASEILCICQGSISFESSLDDDPQYLKDYMEQINLRNIKTREILQDTPATLEYKVKYESPIHQLVISPRNINSPFGHVDKNIYANKISYISHDNKVGIIIDDETLAAAEKSQFETLWKMYHTK